MQPRQRHHAARCRDAPRLFTTTFALPRVGHVAGSIVCLLASLFPGSAFGDRLSQQIIIEARPVEITNAAELKNLGLDQLLAQKLGQLPSAASTLSSPDATKAGLGASPSTATLHEWFSPDERANGLKVRGLLTTPQFETIMQTLRDQKNVQLLQPMVVRVFTDQPANVDLSKFTSPAVTLRVTPTVAPDGRSIALNLSPGRDTLSVAMQPADLPPFTPNDVPVVSGVTTLPDGLRKPMLVFVTSSSRNVLQPSPGGYEPNDPVKVGLAGTGETIGHIADLNLQNVSNQPLSFFIPAVVIESKSRKQQDYACPHEQHIDLAAGETKTVPVDGVCVNRDKPPAGRAETGDLVLNSADGGAPHNPDCHTPPKAARDLLRLTEAKYDCVNKLQQDGELKDFPYHDKDKQRDILLQWSTWMDPRICDISGSKPATKEDLKKVVYKQIEEHGPVSHDTKKKVDQGIDTIFDKIELTTAKAKDLEKPDSSAQAQTEPQQEVGPGSETTSPPDNQSYEIGDTARDGSDSASPTEEKKKKKKKGKTWPKPIQDWIDKKKAALNARWQLDTADQQYQDQFRKYLQKSPHYKEVRDNFEKADAKAKAGGAPQADKDAAATAEKELKKLEADLEKDFQKTPEGQKEIEKVHTAEKASNQADSAEKEAGKNIDSATKDGILMSDLMKQWEAEEKDKAKKAEKPVKAKW